MMTLNPLEQMNQKLDLAMASFSVLFHHVQPEHNAERCLNGAENLPFLKLLDGFLFTAHADLTAMAKLGKTGWYRLPEAADAMHPDSIDFLNELAEFSREESFRHGLDAALLKAISGKVTLASPKELVAEDSEAAFFYKHAMQLTQLFSTLIPDYLNFLKEHEKSANVSEMELVPRIRPSAFRLTAADSIFLKLTSLAVSMELRKCAAQRESFSAGRVYRYLNGEFKPYVLKGIRKVDEFYGYQEARRTFLEHFKAFSDGESNLPLLITSLPGLGKTQMTISHSLSFSNIILIIPEPEDIAEGLEMLIRRIAAHPEKKFLIFFDDIDSQTTNWYYFRANVGGTFSLPGHVAIAIASNQQFPANISSRGRGFLFPTFDEIRCQEMIADFLRSKGVRNAAPELISVIASDYVEEFGQKQFEELSPRTLVRYLTHYQNDPKKCRRMLEISRGDVITRPDAQVFYEENVKLLRSIYGEAAIEELRRRQIDGI